MQRSLITANQMQRATVLVVSSLFAILLIAQQLTADDPPHLADFACAIERPQVAPRLTDIPFSSRWLRPMDSNDPHDTFESAKAFHATRFDWCYVTDPKFAARAKEMGCIVFGTINAELDGSTDREGREKDCFGKLMGNPELPQLVARGDTASEHYFEVAMRHLRKQIDAGVHGIMVDDPGMNYHSAIYLNGGYGDETLKQFREFLSTQTTPEQRKEWRLPADLSNFDYAAYVREHQQKPPQPVRDLFLEFHRLTLKKFYERIRAEIDQYAGWHVPFAGNNWSLQHQSGTPFVDHLDFWLAETSVKYGKPDAKRIYEKIKRAESLGKMQLFSPPNDGLDIIPTREEYVALCRQIIATTYASGSVAVVPWDVWRRGDNTPRFFGTREEFGDLYGLIAEHPDLYAKHEEVFSVGPGIEPQSADNLKAAPLTTSSEQLFATVRAVPGKRSAPVAIHLVDWSEKASPLKLRLVNSLFGWPVSDSIQATLYRPGEPSQKIKGFVDQDGTNRFELAPLKTYAVLSVTSPQ